MVKLILIMLGLSSAEPGLVAHWSFDEGSGSIAHDGSGNGNHGTLVNSPSWVEGVKGYALNFDGTNYIEVPPSQSINSITSQITITAWIKSDFRSRGAIVANWYYDKSVTPAIGERAFVCTALGGENAGKFDFGLSPRGDGKGSVWITTRDPVSPERWVHVAFVSDGSTMAIYVDGELEASADAPSSIHVPGRPIYIGVWNAKEATGPELSDYFRGSMDEVKIYNVALSHEEIWREYSDVAGAGNISGTVKDLTGAPIQGASVECGPISVSTDSEGRYLLEHVPSGTRTVIVRKSGYKPVIAQVEVVSGETSEQDFEMAPGSEVVYVATDGTGDYNCDGVDDHVEINLAISSVEAMGGGTVHIKAGTYVINDAIVLCSNLNLQGDGEEVTVIKLRDQNNRRNWALFTGSGVSQVVVRDITVDGNKHNQTGVGINGDVDGFRIYNSSEVEIYDVSLVDFWTDGFEFSRSVDCRVEDCKVIQCGHEGLRAIYCENITFCRNYVHSEGTGNAGVRIYESSGCVVEGNYFNVYGFGVLINPQGGVPCGNNIYRGNYIEGHYGLPGIAVYAYDTPISGERFVGNIIARVDGHQEDYGHGIALKTLENGSLRDIRIVNNVINDAIKSGIYVEPGSDAEGIVAKNNIIVRCKEYGIYGDVASSYNDLWDNLLGNYGGGASPGVGDISADPLFSDPGRDFHLKSRWGRWNGTEWVEDDTTSPCIDAGDPADDFSKEPQPNGGRINMGAYGNTAEASKSRGTWVEEEGVVPDGFRLCLNFPNPFNRSTAVVYSVAEEGEVKLEVYNLLGRKVRVLVEGRLKPGCYLSTWDGKDDRGRELCSGVYLLVLDAGGVRDVRKVLMVK